MNQLNEILKSCIGKNITRLSIGNYKIFPLDNGNLLLKNMPTEGFFNITSNNIIIVCLGLRDANGNFIYTNFDIEYVDNRVKNIKFDNVKINF